MTIVNSVLGPLDTADFGVTLAHEHVFSSSPGIPQVYPELLDNGYKDLIIKGLNEAKAGGIKTLVDATTLDLGRDVNLLAEVSRITGVNIIACTGWWMEKLRFLSGMSPDRLAQSFIREIRQGMGL